MDRLVKVDAVTGVRRLFYAVTPNETSFENIEDVPPYILEAVPFFILAVILEEIVLQFENEGKGVSRFADTLTSMTAGMFMTITSILMKSLEVSGYIYLYANYHLVTLPWDSPWTWVVTFLAVDLAYYWFHRMAHEVNIIWATHQVHHSSEEYNLSTALRQSVFQRYFSVLFYMPLAFFAPPSSMLVHNQFNTLYQFWIHTELIKTVGPLEYILNTPSHHRVHHGRNRYCIDKNYAGTLIIWDRMFGTFEAENEPIAYGLVHPINTWNPITVQMCHLQWMWGVFWSTQGFRNKLSVIFKGPGWEPGKPRLGLIEDIPDIRAPQPKYHTDIPGWMKTYIMFHFIINVLVFQTFMDSFKGLSQLHAACGMLYIIFTFTCIGMLCDLRPWWYVLAEMARCALVFAVTSLALHSHLGPDNILLFLQMAFGLSLLFWILRLNLKDNGKEKSS